MSTSVELYSTGTATAFHDRMMEINFSLVPMQAHSQLCNVACRKVGAAVCNIEMLGMGLHGDEV